MPNLKQVITLSSVRSNFSQTDHFEQIANDFREQAGHSQIMLQIVEKHTDLHKDHAKKHAKLEKKVIAIEKKLEGKIKRIEARLEDKNSGPSTRKNTNHAENTNVRGRAGASSMGIANGSESAVDPWRHFKRLENKRYECPHCEKNYSRYWIVRHANATGCKTKMH